MKALRVWFLLLLAMLLPLRGAVAATMLCELGSAGVQTELRLGHHPAGHATTPPAVDHDHAQAHGHEASPQDHAASDTCTLCSAFCSLTPLAGTSPTLAEPPGLAAVQRTDHAAPAPSFLSDGQERPPRTC